MTCRLSVGLASRTGTGAEVNCSVSVGLVLGKLWTVLNP